MSCFKGVGLFVLVTLALLLRVGMVHAELAPDFAFTDIDGNHWSLSGFRGSIVILNFFGIKCSGCMAEMAEFKAVYGSFGTGLVIVSLAVWGETDEALRSLRTNRSIPWVIARDPGVWHNLYHDNRTGGGTVPTFFTINRAGSIRYAHTGLTSASVIAGEIKYIISGDVVPLFSTIDMKDVSYVAKRFNTDPSQPLWDSNADIDATVKIDMKDIAIVARNFGRQFL